MADKPQFRAIKTIGADCSLHEGGKGFCFRDNILLVKAEIGETAEPAGDLFFRAAAAHAQKGGARCCPVRQRHQARFTAAGTVQQDDGAAISFLGRVETVHEGQVAIDDAFFARHRELRQGDTHIRLVLHEERRDEQFFAERVQRFVHRHARPIGRHFDQHAARFADVERVEIFPVMGVGGAGIQRFQPG
ncbi:hypothetical protein D3C72_1129890 [compost metagenome]